ncbi:hypothetical protein ERFG_00543 [Escherichia coli TW10509]|nr:hypothetical protein ERFG_00543 [Escherichia coli TW10509]
MGSGGVVVYPRWRGELTRSGFERVLHSGLSPLARGTHYAFLRLPGFCRFIPAGAGNSVNWHHITLNHPVYPRWRGELRFLVAAAGLKTGLSPLARGTHELWHEVAGVRRFIPAGAGNSEGAIVVQEGGAVYPRWRGELPVRVVRIGDINGLSPLARGTL